VKAVKSTSISVDGASRVAQWLRDSGYPETLGLHPGSVVTGCDREVRGVTHNWPSIVRVREGLAGRNILVSTRTSDSCGGLGTVRANQGCQVHSVSSDTLRLASGLDALCVKKQGLWDGDAKRVVYRRTHNFQPLSLPSPYGSCSY
jgi:hypothetical protein